MEELLIYLLKVSVSITVCYLTYHFLLRKHKQFVFNRFYLIGSFLVSFLIPLITFETTAYAAPADVFFAPGASGAEMQGSVVPGADRAGLPLIAGTLLVIYLAGASYYLARLIYAYSTAARIKEGASREWVRGVNVYVSEDNIRAFTFLDNIIIGKNVLGHPSLDKVLTHELVHSKEKHFLDILITELLLSLQWFNPFARLQAKAVRNNLEFRADDIVIQKSDSTEYQLAILSMVRNRVQPPLFTELNSSNLKKRIIMMKNNNQHRFSGIARLAIIPVFAVLIISLSGKDTVTAQADLSGISGTEVAQTGEMPRSYAENAASGITSVEEMKQYIMANMRYPREAAESGQVGVVELYARVGNDGAIREVTGQKPDGNYVEADEVIIVANALTDAGQRESSNHRMLVAEGRRVLESFPELEIPSFMDQTVKFQFRFVLQ